ncbi:universal stress domain containing protein [Acanthamoeba castellanii str. Neff]|uniref:Universal stress domain containing protein n=1 Tax=Acanthamoeba castellanii (strain ATCC 30010 / Neff) TaxID=1257118 RepID=L8GPP6_ACACF|nr:universal stress domain containing protein [Acanthamoeba castellanii str. Neff]ELR14985.1 universal stress domain containing protein [Acanthamoeba castellanii str. Neff]
MSGADGASQYMVCLDGSEVSKNSLRLALRLLRPDDDSLLLLYWGYDIPNDEVDAMARLVLNQSESYLAEAEKLARESGAKQVTTKAVLGFPRDQILLVAEEEGVEMIVMGARGLSPIKKLLMGSVSSHVLSNAACPVLVVK